MCLWMLGCPSSSIPTRGDMRLSRPSGGFAGKRGGHREVPHGDSRRLARRERDARSPVRDRVGLDSARRGAGRRGRRRRSPGGGGGQGAPGGGGPGSGLVEGGPGGG